MICFSDIVDDFVFGEYNLKDLVNFNDLLMILLKMMVVRGVLWEISNILNIFGNFVFLFDFNGVIEVEIVKFFRLYLLGIKLLIMLLEYVIMVFLFFFWCLKDVNFCYFFFNFFLRILELFVLNCDFSWVLKLFNEFGNKLSFLRIEMCLKF